MDLLEEAKLEMEANSKEAKQILHKLFRLPSDVESEEIGKLVDYIVEAAVLKTAIITSEVMRKKG